MFPGNLMRFACVLGSLFLFSCATGQVDRIAPTVELPKDLEQKFKVEETQAMIPLASPVPLPVDEKPAKASKSKKTKKVQKAVAKEFIYPNRRQASDPMPVGETLVYEVTFFGVAAGRLTMEIGPYAQINQRKVYHVIGHARTAKFFEMFYRVDDTVETFMDFEGLFSHRFHLTLDETKQTRDSLELYDSEKGQAYYWNRWNHYKKGFSEIKEYRPMEKFPQDSISALYYMRSLPLAIGKKFKVPVVTEGNTWEAQIEVLRTEMTDTPMGNVRCFVLQPETRFQGALKKTGESLFWVTDDERKVLVRVEAKVKIGTVVLQLKEASFGAK